MKRNRKYHYKLYLDIGTGKIGSRKEFKNPNKNSFRYIDLNLRRKSWEDIKSSHIFNGSSVLLHTGKVIELSFEQLIYRTAIQAKLHKQKTNIQ